MSKHGITIGHTEGRAAMKLDIPRLIVSRMLITAASGGGKSWLLRVILEAVSETTQTIVIDPEGEFASLRELRDMVLVGADGDLPADPRSAGLLCRRLMEQRVSAVLDIFELTPTKRREFVANFCQAMVDLPKSLWRPCVVAVDEAHEFAPEGDTYVSSEPLALLSSKGRKRGYCPIHATTRLSKLSKDVAADLKTRFVGQTILDVDQRRAADFLGFPKSRWAELRDLSPPGREGEWFAVGPALSERGVVKFRSIQVKTTHPRPGQGKIPEPPQPSQKIRGILDELKDLPQQAAEEIKNFEQATRRIAELERDLRRAATATRSSAPAATVRSADVARLNRTIGALRAGLEQAMRVIAALTSKGFEKTGVDPEDIRKALDAAKDQIVRIVEQKLSARNAEIERWKNQATAILGKLQKLLAEDVNVVVDVKHNEPFTISSSSAAVPASNALPGLVADATARAQISGPVRKIVDAYAWWHSIGVDRPTRNNIAPLAGYANVRSKGFTNPLSECRTSGLVENDALSEAGVAVALFPAAVSTLGEYHDKLRAVLDGPQTRVLNALLDAGGQSPRADLASAAGYDNVRSKGFTNPLSRLSAMGLVEAKGGDVKGTALLFPQGLAPGRTA